MKKIFKFIFVLCAFCAAAQTQAQTQTQTQAQVARPKLVVGLVVDQMRWDYLYRYYNRYSEGGFKRLMNEGFTYDNCRLPYIPSVTAIGHTSIYTGSVPSIHGIAGNSFCQDGKIVSATYDANVQNVGSKGKEGMHSPHMLWATTIGDELRIATNGRSKVVGIAIKPRASILPAGHYANAAYWMDTDAGKFITSSFYMDKLPGWLNTFNKKNLAKKYLSEKWNTLYPIDTYTQSTEDDVKYEDGIRKDEKAVFPVDLPALTKKYGNDILRNTPFGNTITMEMAKAAIEGENLGGGDETDFLAISCSSTDAIGHQVGPNAIEMEDCYLRLDKDFADFFSYLDQKVGKGNYTLFLTADHGGMNNTLFLQDRRIPSNSWNTKAAKSYLEEALKAQFGNTEGLIIAIFNYQVFFDLKKIEALGLDYNKVKEVVVNRLKKDKDVHYAFDMEKTATESVPDEVKTRAINGYCRERSGGVQIILKPAFYDHGLRGTSHGEWNGYDTHTPLIFMGWGIQHGVSNKRVNMTDIAATICALLHIQAPNGCIGEPIF